MEFQEWPKIPRLTRKCTITEKIDGTNASVVIADIREYPELELYTSPALVVIDHLAILAGSRTRWVTLKEDNHGWARWVFEHSEDLLHLGPGHHYGEWWGRGIQRGYGLNEKRFSLFNTKRWSDPVVRPACCHVVPVLYEGEFATDRCNGMITELRIRGSQAAPGFMNPEGIVIYHHAANSFFKKTLEKDESPKGAVE